MTTGRLAVRFAIRAFGALVLGAGLSAVPALGQDEAQVATGKQVWSDAGCSNCHGPRGQGGISVDFPRGPSLRTTALDKETMLEIIKCGIPGTRMPAWLKGAYTEVECYGEPTGSLPSGMTVPAAFTEDELTALVEYIFATFVQTPQQ